MADSFSFDAETAARNGAAGQAELPPELAVEGHLWPIPADLISNHAAEGAPYLPTARDIPTDPPQGPLWAANHDGPTVPAVSPDNQAAAPSGAHAGSQGKGRYGLLDIGRPFTAQVTRFVRHLATDIWDSTGKRVSPTDAPSAPVQIYGSEHNTRPRMIEAKLGPLFGWNWPAGQQFSVNPGYLGVNAGVPDYAQRPAGAVAAQEPDDPFVAAAAGQPRPAGPVIDYDLGI